MGVSIVQPRISVLQPGRVVNTGLARSRSGVAGKDWVTLPLIS